jgi:hypothetical protein
MGRARWVRAALAGLLLSILACGDDDSGRSIFDCPDCEHWTKLFEGHVNFPAYMPGSTDIIAFSSDRGNNKNIENIWIADLSGRSGEPVFYPITDSPSDEFDPSWSPDGTRLAYTAVLRDEMNRPGYEIFMIRVDDFSNPGDEVRLTNTDFSSEAVVSRPAASTWLDNRTILYSNGQDVFVVELDGSEPGAPTKVINDPSDFIFSGTKDFVENQASAVRLGGRDLVFFVSDSRVPFGSIRVEAKDVGGDTVHAEIFLEGVPTGVRTPSVVGGRPLGNYVVGASVTDPRAFEDYCDTLLSAPFAVFENDTTDVNFTFDNPRGTIVLIAGPWGSNFYYDSQYQGVIRRDTTIIECVYPGLHELKLVSIEARDSEGNLLRDSLWVSVGESEIKPVTLDVSGRTGKARGAGGATSIRPLRAVRKGAESAQHDHPVLWKYDSEDGSYVPVSEPGEYPSHPAVDPTGEYLAYIVDFRRLKVVSTTSGLSRWVSLPGATGINICFREAMHPCWSSDGARLLLSLSPCIDQPSSDGSATEFDGWEVEIGPFLPR